MLITKDEFKNSGMPTSKDIIGSTTEPSKEVDIAITTVEEYYLKPRLTDQHYIDLLSNPTVGDNPILLNGGNITIGTNIRHFAGLKQGLYHLVFAYLLVYHYNRLTRYGSVRKDSEYSRDPDLEDLYAQAKIQWEIGMTFVEEIMDYYQISTDRNNLPNLFETIVW